MLPPSGHAQEGLLLAVLLRLSARADCASSCLPAEARPRPPPPTPHTPSLPLPSLLPPRPTACPACLQFEKTFPDKATPIVVGCLSGKRSLMAAELLSAAGYTRLQNVEGGYQGERQLAPAGGAFGNACTHVGTRSPGERAGEGAQGWCCVGACADRRRWAGRRQAGKTWCSRERQPAAACLARAGQRHDAAAFLRRVWP